MSTTLIDRLTALVDSGEASRSGLARAAGLHPNSLRKLGSTDWNPTADTLVRLEKLIDGGVQDVLVGAEAIIDEARNGRMFILVDDDDRENEGDLVIPAQMATPDAINFMARHGRGLICLALGKERVDQLGLEPMARINGTQHGNRLHRVDRGARRESPPGSAPPTGRGRSRWRSTPPTARTRSSRRAMSSRWSRGRAGCWSAPAIPRPRSTSRGWPASTHRA